MTVSAGIDVGNGAVKAVVMSTGANGPELVAHACGRIRKRDIAAVVDEVFRLAADSAGVERIHYVATTGEGEDVELATGHFYGMTTHARGALFLEPRATAVLDIGALHARAVAMDPRGRVLRYKMTSQCASGSGQFLENIARYLGVSQAEIGPLSLQAADPEKISSICAVLAETDVINMVSRGISAADILRGIHDSMAVRFGRLLRSIDADGVVFLSGGLALDVGLQAALAAALDKERTAASGVPPLALASHVLSIHAGAIGAAIWGAYRYEKLGLGGTAWTRAGAA
ncbi:MAG: benzoyl-CoA reductase subunit D [Candidatus Schekmanbacteria bacterium]|nr:benzoyl-CoA reductase subunit D [Candidatus Schekmanbacteria bacterium]